MKKVLKANCGECGVPLTKRRMVPKQLLNNEIRIVADELGEIKSTERSFLKGLEEAARNLDVVVLPVSKEKKKKDKESEN